MMRCATSVICLLLSGCGVMQQIEINQKGNAAKEQLTSSLRACANQYPDKHLKPVSPRVECSLKAYMAFEEDKQRVIGNPNIAIAQLSAAKARALASRYDRGEISSDGYDVEMAKIMYEYQTVSTANDQRTADRQQAIASENAAQLQQSLATAAAITQPPPIAAPPMQMPTTTNCNFYPGTATCQTY